MRRSGVVRLRVKDVAQEKGVGIAKLSRLSDISYKTIQKVWRNPYHNASLSTINRIAKVLNVPTTELLEDVPEDLVPEEFRTQETATE